jgi:hypothetical protein
MPFGFPVNFQLNLRLYDTFQNSQLRILIPEVADADLMMSYGKAGGEIGRS